MRFNKPVIVMYLLIPVVQIINPTPIEIRSVQESDFSALKSLGVKTFSLVNKLTTPEEIGKLEKTYDALFDEEQMIFSENPQKMIALVAIKKGAIVGYFSAYPTDQADECYARFFMVDSELQKQGLGKQLLHRFREQVPALKRVVCVTNKKNSGAQKLYEYFGGKKVENPAWSIYLYSMLNKADYVGYEFDGNAIAAFDENKWRQKSLK
jgi:ribosomal protein S18 acetylase RimI-like enzyme